MKLLYIIFFSFLLFDVITASGGFDHGTSTGKGKFQLDVTWNPFNYFKHGQSYIVLNYGLTEKLDVHAYYCDHSNYNNGVKSYYYGIYYQFLDTKYLDLATACGKRKMGDLSYSHLFFPQLLYNFKFNNKYTIGGSIVRVNKKSNNFLNNKNNWYSFDISLFIPLTKFFTTNNRIEELKVGIGLFMTDINNSFSNATYLPTYSIDTKFRLFN